MYAKGDARLHLGGACDVEKCSAEWDSEGIDPCPHVGTENRTLYDSGQRTNGRIVGPLAILPHRCSEWVIGRKPDVLQMIKDLTRLWEELPDV